MITMEEDLAVGCGNCTKLKWNRKRLGLSQKEFAKKVGLSQPEISILERDETAWGTLKDETADRIYDFYASMASWQPENAREIIREINNPKFSQEEIEEDDIEQMEEVEMEQVKTIESGLHKEDIKILGLIEFAYEELEKSETHEDFSISIQMLKKILNRY